MKIFGYRYLPLNVYLAYSLFVLISLFVGPIEYDNIDYFVLISYVSAIVLLFSIGFVVGARGECPHSSDFRERATPYKNQAIFFRTILILSVVSALVRWYTFLSSGGKISLDGIGESYIKGYEGYERGQASVDIFYVLGIFDQAVAVLVLVSFFYYYQVMGRTARVAFLFVVGTYLMINVIGTGKQKYLGDVVIFLFYCLAINLAARGRVFTLSKFLSVSVGVMIVFALFVTILKQRYAAAGIDLYNIHEKSHQLITWNHDSLFFDLVSDEYVFPIGIFLFYFTNGLYGLYLSLTLPFEWTYFVGNSYSMGRVVEILLGANGAILERTYPYRVGEVYGWDFGKWHSLFSWLASDITFTGVLFLSPVFAFIYARLWLQAIRGSNSFAGPLFIYLSMGLIFSFANNQIMHSLAGMMVLVILFIGWLSSGCRVRRHVHKRGLQRDEPSLS